MNQQLKDLFSSKKNIINLVVLAVLAITLPLGINLAKNRQIFFSKAERGAPIELAEGNCVSVRDGKKILTCANVPLKLISPFGFSSCLLGKEGQIPNVTNLVKNGSFEDPIIVNAQTNNTWKDYAGAESIPGWDPMHQGDPYQVELQAKGLYGTPAQGNQYAEVDITNKIALTQQIPTASGASYILKFAYFPRPVAGSQKLGVYWNNQLIDTISGTGGPAYSDLNWEYHTYTVSANSATSTLGFGSLENETQNAGNFIDDVTLIENCVPPTPPPTVLPTPPSTTPPTPPPTVLPTPPSTTPPTPPPAITFVTQPWLGRVDSRSAEINFKNNICPQKSELLCYRDWGSSIVTYQNNFNAPCTNGLTQNADAGYLADSKNYVCSVHVVAPDGTEALSNQFAINTPKKQ